MSKGLDSGTNVVTGAFISQRTDWEFEMAKYTKMNATGVTCALSLAGILVVAAVAGAAVFAAPEVGSAAKARGQHVTVIHKDPKGHWPGGSVWIGRSACGAGNALVSEAGRCAVVINPSVGIDI
jgi:hypothetical protein